VFGVGLKSSSRVGRVVLLRARLKFKVTMWGRFKV
jgi:hypothetical protein